MEDGSSQVSGFTSAGSAPVEPAPTGFAESADDVSQRVALVTGSSRGLGRAMALALGALGHPVAVHYLRSEGPAQEVAAAVRALGARAAVFGADIASAAACRQLVAEVTSEFGSLDILVNNAGITKDGLVVRMKEEEWETVLSTDLSSAFYLSKAALRPMLRSGWGRIVNIASVVGMVGNTGQANYVAAKAGLVGLTKALAQEYGGKGITANAVAPGFIASDMTAELGDDLKKAYLARIPAGRFGRPEEVADLVAFLTSARAGYINGQTVVVDGGMVMH